MIRARLTIVLLTIVLAACSAARADSGNPLRDELRAFKGAIAAQCRAVEDQRKDFSAQSDPLTAYTLRDAVQSLCFCMPDKTQTWMNKLSQQDLEGLVSETEFMSALSSHVIDLCAAEQMNAMYGWQCHERFNSRGIDVNTYCPCMSEVARKYSNAETAAIAAAASNYLPLAAEAEKSGEPIPPRPPILESYYQADQVCKNNKGATEVGKPHANDARRAP